LGAEGRREKGTGPISSNGSMKVPFWRIASIRPRLGDKIIQIDP